MDINSKEHPGARQAPPQDLKTKLDLIRKHFPKVDPAPFADKLASIDEGKDGRVILHFHEEDRIDVEPKKGSVRQFGVGAAAKALGQALADSTLARFFQHPDDDWGRAKSPSKPIKLAPLTRAECEGLAAKWQETGFDDVSISKRGVLVQVDTASYLRDRGDEAILEGQPSEKAIVALMVKAERDWGGRIELIGTDEYKAQAWKIAQQYGVTVVGYEPPIEVELGGRDPGTSHAPKPEDVAKVDESGNVERKSSNVEKQSSERSRVEPSSYKTVVPKILAAPSTIKSAPSLVMVDILSAANDDTYDIEPFNDDSPSP